MRGFIGARQTTLASEISLTGTGVHSGAPVSITLYPADGDTGIRFLLSNGHPEGTEIVADQRSVTGVTLCTIIGDGNGCSVATVEHLMAALRGLGVDNALIEIDSSEVPIMDGSASRFVEAIDEVGLAELDAPRRYLKVLKKVVVEDAGAYGALSPHNGFHLDVEIDFLRPYGEKHRCARREGARTIVCERHGGPLGGRSTITIRLSGPPGLPSTTIDVRSETHGGLFARDRRNVLEFMTPFHRRVC